jgi:hypothetical protein
MARRLDKAFDESPEVARALEGKFYATDKPARVFWK